MFYLNEKLIIPAEKTVIPPPLLSGHLVCNEKVALFVVLITDTSSLSTFKKKY